MMRQPRRASMPLRKLRFVCVAAYVVACLLGLVGPVAARKLGASLQGTELLVELRTDGPSVASPGIYYWRNGTAELKRVITHGRCPRWSPSRGAFAYDLGRETWVADLAAMRTMAAQRIVPYLVAPLPFHGPIAQYPAISWSRNESSLIRWRVTSNAETLTWPVLMPEVLRIEQAFPKIMPLLSSSPGRGIGRIAFHPDGRLAYEEFSCSSELGPADRVLWIASATREARQKLELTDCTAALNPLWSPTGAHLAVDCVSAEGTRQTLILNDELGQPRRIPFPIQDWDNWMQGVAWCPDGSSLLVAAGPGNGLSMRRLYRAAIPESGAIEIVESLGVCPEVYDARWSPSGDAVAILEGQETLLTCAKVPQVTIWMAASGEVAELTCPTGLRPTAIDW